MASCMPQKRRGILTVVVFLMPPLLFVLVDVPQASGPGHGARLVHAVRSTSGDSALGNGLEGAGPRVVCGS